MVDDNLHRVSVQPSLNLNKFKSQQKKKNPNWWFSPHGFSNEGVYRPHQAMGSNVLQ